MAFDYQTLKKYKSESFIDLTVQSGDIEDSAVNADKIADGNVTSGKLANSSVDLGGNKVTGTMPTSKGGLGTGTQTTAYNMIRSNGNGTITSGVHGIINMSVYLSLIHISEPTRPY